MRPRQTTQPRDSFTIFFLQLALAHEQLSGREKKTRVPTTTAARARGSSAILMTLKLTRKKIIMPSLTSPAVRLLAPRDNPLPLKSSTNSSIVKQTEKLERKAQRAERRSPFFIHSTCESALCVIREGLDSVEPTGSPIAGQAFFETRSLSHDKRPVKAPERNERCPIRRKRKKLVN